MREKLKQILEVTNNELDNIPTDYANKFNVEDCFHGSSGREHYRLLMYISQIFKGSLIFDVGTLVCRSAIALSYNDNTMVRSFDIIQSLPENVKKDNIEYILGDCTLDKDFKTVPFIFLDVAHDGTYEEIFYNHLKSINWNGILLLDDIHLNVEMKKFWSGITEEKHDITGKGHWSGTGVVLFQND
jgi:predicted O-methyltransferase YrrM